MARSTRHDWFSFRRAFSRRPAQQRPTGRQPFQRRLRIEPLEDRRLLALVTVDTLNDTVDLGDGVTSLREAIFATNLVGGADTIEFAAALTSGGPATILLTMGELKITDSTTIIGHGANLLTIDASGNDPTPDSTLDDGDFSNDFDGSRVFNIDDGTSTLLTVAISGLTLTGGDGGSFLSGGAIFARENLMVTGSTISGNSNSGQGGGIASFGGNLTVSGSTISGNSAGGTSSFVGSGGGIFSIYGTLTVTNSTISGNSADQGGGIATGFGHLMLTSSTISGNSARIGGGGIFSSYGNLTVTGSTISGNSTTYDGGGIWIGDSIGTVTNSTISSNLAGRDGGGIWKGSSGLLVVTGSTLSGNSAASEGGGIYSGANLTMTNSTLSGNRATAGSGGGLHLFGTGTSTFTIRHSTIVSNSANIGGGVFLVGGTLTLDHSILASNTAAVGPDLTRLVDAVVNPRFSLIGSSANSGLAEAPVGAPDANGNLIGGSVNGLINPRLGPLANNGGPTKTHALLSVSPALDAGNPDAMAGGVPDFDQRGAPFTRIFDGDGVGGARIDIGAYENRPLTFVVDTLADENDGDYSTGDFSLREAIAVANGSNNPDYDVIKFDEALSIGGPATIVLTLGELAISDSLAINGPGANLLTIDASGNDPTPDVNNGDGSRVFNIDDGTSIVQSSVSISGLTLTGGDVTGNGGGFHASVGNVTVTSSTISGNSAGFGSGGGIFTTYGSVTVTASTISGNSAGSSYGGGGIYARNGNVTVTSSTISGNSAGSAGGGIATGGNVTVTSSTISGNSAGFGSGGGIFTTYGSVTVTASTISGNSAGSYGGGGGISAYGGAVTITNSIVAGNLRTSGTDPPVADDLVGSSIFTLGYSIVGAAVSAINTIPGTINYFDDDPRLGPLADNGGPTQTQALLPGSPAINAGDPAAVAGMGGVPLYDQRGAPFDRVSSGRIDIGAFELQPLPPAFFGDYNQNNVVDAADYSVWRNTLGSSVAAYDGADGDGNGTIDQDDYGVWRAHFGRSVPSAGAGSGFAEASSVESQELRAEALSMLRIAADHVGEPVQLPTLPTSAPTDTEAATARAASFAPLETRSLWQDLSSPSRGRLHRYSVTESGADDLSLLLAIDRDWLSRRRDPFVSDDSVNDEHRVNDDHGRSLIDQPLAARCRPTHWAPRG